MIRPLALAAGLYLLALAGAASAQSWSAPSWGQPVYLNARGQPVGGSPLSEVETRAYVETGRWADGYQAQPYVYVPGHAPAHSYDRRGYAYRPQRHSSYRRHDARPYQGYRDEWGYQDDRPRPSRLGYVDDPYLYDR